MSSQALLRISLAAVVALTAVPTRAASKTDLHKLRSTIEALISASGAETVAVAFSDLGSDRELLIKPDVAFHAASTMKVPVMIEVFRQVAEGALSLDDSIILKNEFKSIVDGS